MRNATTTKENIIVTASAIFNVHGYAGTSIQDIMDKTGLKKGGIYRHFESKEALAAEAFRYAYQSLKKAYTDSLAHAVAPPDKIFTFLDTLREFALHPPVKGGCPILNTATEVDDTNPMLRDEVKKAANDWESIITRILQDGQEQQLFHPRMDATAEARFLVLTVEGAILMSKLHRNVAYIEHAATVLRERIQSFLL
jgi:TetR/AcrR family transcriptional regulator, transcriptional repressor for nem operon